MSTPTEITVRPSAPLSRPEKPIFGVYTPGDTDVASMDDVAKAANPLHYIPFVSQLYESATGNTGSAAMKIIGGAILGGPIGLIAGIANAVFEQETGKTVVASIADAITGNDSAQVASAAKPSAEAGQQVASLQEAPAAPTQEILPPLSAQAAPPISSLQAAQAAQNAQMQISSSLGEMNNGTSQKDMDILSLFGAQQKSAHKSYQQAQMLPYLKDVNSSMVM